MYQPTTTSFDFNTSSHLNTPEMNFYQRHGSIDYSRRPSYPFVGFSEASFSDQETHTPSPFSSYEDYHPLEKRRLSHFTPPPPSSFMNWYPSPMMYSMDMYPASYFLNTPCPATEGIVRDRAPSSSSLSSSSCDSSYVDSPPASRRVSKVKSTSSRSRGRRVSNCPAADGEKMFACTYDECGKVFKRSEHLKRHIRSIHTLEKPYECPYQSCSKKFSRSDNLNQHIRIHRNTSCKDKNKAASSSRNNVCNYSPY